MGTTPTTAHRDVGVARYRIGRSAGRFTVQAFATGILAAFGHNPNIAIRDFEGDVECAAGSIEHASLRVTVRMTNLEVLTEMKKDDRLKLEEEMYQRVLDVSRYPQATFTSHTITVQNVGGAFSRASVSGELEFHGVRRDLAFDARLTRLGTPLRISGEFTLRQSDYGIKPMSFAGGALKLKDDLKFQFELMAEKEE